MVKTKPNKKRSKKNPEKENEEEQESNVTASNATVRRHTIGHGPIFTIFTSAQQNETCHKRYIKELKQLYTKLEHNPFMSILNQVFKTVLEAEEGNEFGNTALGFCAKFVTSFESERTHPILAETFSWLLSTISNNPHIRYRICFFVNLILKHLGLNAALEDTQCDQILHYMLERLKDVSPSVRKEAVLAMQRLQMPDDPSDLVTLAYQYHLSSDPSSSVRQCIIKCMGRNYLTMPHILKRLWDVDEKVRRQIYVHMCNYPVRSYKVSQRLTLLERGLNDISESVRKNAIKYMLSAWLEAYQHNYIELTAALKLDSNEEEIIRFRRVARQMLLKIFEKHDNSELIEQLSLAEDCELHCCVPQEILTVELLLYWQTLSDYFQQTQADEYEKVLPELSVFCEYVKRFCMFQKPDMDKFAQIQFQCMLLSLVEIMHSYDLGDEIGRGNMKDLITHLLKECLLDHKIVVVLVRCLEKLISDVAARMQFLIEIIYEICELNAKQNDLVHDRSLIDKLLDDVDTSLVMQIRSLKVKILELEELEENFVRQKEYIKAQAVNNEKNAVTEEYTDLIQPLLEKHDDLELPTRPKLSKQERVLKGLYISFYMVASQHVFTLNPSICKLYKDFICRHFASTDLDTFEWAIKCGTTYSIMYEAYAKEVFDVLVDVIVEQFYKDNNQSLCATAAHCIFELLDNYGVDYFIELNQSTTGQGQTLKSKRRLLYTMQDFFDGDDDRSQASSNDQGTDIIGMMGFFMEKASDKNTLLAIVKGLCRLVLRGQLEKRIDLLEKLLKRYFNANTDPIVSQVLGIFFENIVEQKLQRILQPCLLPIVWSVMNSSYNSPLNDVVPEHVTKFFIDITVQQTSTPQDNIHNQIALSFLQYIQNYYTERKEMCRLLSKELSTLKVNVFKCVKLKEELNELANKLVNSKLEPRVIRNIVEFQTTLNDSLKTKADKPNGDASDAEAEDCESIITTTASAVDVPLPAAPAPDNSSNIIVNEPESADTAKEIADAVSTSSSVPPVLPDPVLTTYGANNQVGIRYLRRSLHNSISQSDNDSRSGSPRTELEDVDKQRQNNPANEISRKNLRKRHTKQRLEQAMARASVTPEKRIECENESADESIASATSEASIAAVIKERSRSTPEQTLNTSEEIAESPTIIKNASHIRLRSMRNQSTPTGRKSVGQSSSKRKVLHLETQVPLRNGRKRVLHKSQRAVTFTTTSQSSDSSSLRVSPQRKQQRLEAITPSRPKAGTETSKQATGSPTGSSTSSVKENNMPSTPRVTNKAPQSGSRRSSANDLALSSSSRVLTRHSARKLRISGMCMTRKRMSLEMSLTEGQLTSTPKRVRQGRTTRMRDVGNEANTSSRSSGLRTVATSSPATRTRRK